MKLYNTKTKQIEEFIPYNKDNVTMYTCGPTVYHFAHIGNLRTYIEEDVLEKTLNYLGYKVKRVMNITDVGHLSNDSDTGLDKMVDGAKRENKTVLEIAKFYTDAFFNDCTKLNIKKPEIIVQATSLIDEYIKIISKLIDDGYAYFCNGNVYFDTSKLTNYYSLTNHNENDLLVGVRENVSEDLNKKNKTDFVLWFTKSKFDSQELKWDSPWGVGYPGWHIECSGISLKYLGEYLDIHCGGVDNIFPHHTNEIAQCEAFLSHPWCKYWFHVEYLNDKNGKMSKSKGDFLTVSLLEQKGFLPLSYRFMVLNSHYQKPLEFSFDTLTSFQNAYLKLKKKISSLDTTGTLDQESYNKYYKDFQNSLSNNLNTSFAITVLYDVLKSDINDFTKIKLIESFDQVLSLNLLKNDKNESIPDNILNLVELRNKYKKEKKFQEADTLRKEIENLGYKILDTREGYKIEKI